MNLITLIRDALQSVWAYVKKIFIRILNFLRNIVNWFRQPERLEKVRHNENVVAVAIKNNLDNGNYNIINCLFDKSEGEIIDYEEDVLSIEAESLDDETRQQFGYKEMLILQ